MSSGRESSLSETFAPEAARTRMHEFAPRRDALRDALRDAALDALLCARPSNVLLCSGYWPMVGTSCALVTRDGRVVVLAPSDERDLAGRAWADELRLFAAGGLADLHGAADAMRAPLADALRQLAQRGAQIGVEVAPAFEPSSYVATYRDLADALRALLDAEGYVPVPADDMLARLRARKTPTEIERIAIACRIAADAFAAGAARLRPHLDEREAAEHFRAPLSTPREPAERSGGRVSCMSGPNAARALGAYARSTSNRLAAGDLVLVHCNSQADGYWTDITRTYCLGQPREHQREMYDAVFAARAAALALIRPGARAADVDRATREAIRAHGFEGTFAHATGHGVGFAAIAHGARPRLHPASSDVLEPGMVFNIEPAIYLEGEAGLRHCDVVVLRDDGPVVLTPFHESLDELAIDVATRAPPRSASA